VSSKLAYDRRGRLIVVATSTNSAQTNGDRFLVCGNDLPVNEVGFGWLGRSSGHLASAAERVEAATRHGSPRLHA
jgi:hypothetical protein